MSDKNIKINMKITDEIIEEYYSKMNALKQKNIIIGLTIMLILIIISYAMKETEMTTFYIGFLIGYFLIIVAQQSRNKKISKELFKTRNKYECIVTEGNIKIIYEDDEIKNKIDYNDINRIQESNNLIIIIYNLNTRVLLINKNLLSKEEMETLKNILSTNLNDDKLKFKKQNGIQTKTNKNRKIGKYLGIILLVLLFIVIAFTYTEESTYVPCYNEFINEQSYKYNGTKDIFPKEIPQSAKMVNYYFYYKYKIISLNPTYQVYLEYTLDENDFESEINRLQNFEHDMQNYKYPAYVWKNDNKDVYEYVLVKEEEKKLIYIFLQNVSKKETNINIKYLPNNI